MKVIMSKKKCGVTFAYRPPYYNKDGIFKELNKSLSNNTRKYQNFLVVGDLSVDILD